MQKFDYQKLSLENGSIAYQVIICTKFLTLNKILDKFLINHNLSDLSSEEKEKVLIQIWIQEISKRTELKDTIVGKSLYLEDLIKKVSAKYNLTIDLKEVNYLKINSPRQDYYDATQSHSYKRIAFLSKIIAATEHFSYVYSEADHANDSAKIAEKVAKAFGLSSHSVYHLKTAAIDHSFGQIALGKSGDDALQRILQKYNIDKDEFYFSHHHNVMRHLMNENASFARINAAASNVVKPCAKISEAELLRQYPYEIQSLCKKLSMVGIFNGERDNYLNNFSNFESQIMNWSDGISWVTNDLKLLLKLELYDSAQIVEEVGFIKDIYQQVTQETLDGSKNFIDKFVSTVREFLIIDYINVIKSRLELNGIKKNSIKYADDIRYAKSSVGFALSDKLQDELSLLISILSKNLYKRFLYTKENVEDGCVKQDLWFDLLSTIVERILYYCENNISLPKFYQDLLENNINYIFTTSYRDKLSRKQNMIIAIIKFLGMDLTDREVLRLCDIIFRSNNTNLKEFFSKYKNKLEHIYDLDELLSEF